MGLLEDLKLLANMQRDEPSMARPARPSNMTTREMMIADAMGGCDGREKKALARAACQHLDRAELRALVTELDRELWKEVKP